MEDYLQKGGFKMQKMNNYKNNFYLYNKFDDNNYVIYAKTNGIRHLLKYHFGIDNNICPNELFILNYGNQATVKIIDYVTKTNKLKQIPYIQKMYELQLKCIPNLKIDYAVMIDNIENIKDHNVFNVVKSFNIRILNSQQDLDLWLDE